MILDLFGRIHEHAQNRPDEIALQDISAGGRESLSYRQLLDDVRSAGALLRECGAEPGCRVALLMENHPRWGVAFLAAQSVRAVVVPLDTLQPPETLAGLIGQAGCRLLIASEKLSSQVQEIQARLAVPVRAVALGAARPGAGEAPVPFAAQDDDQELAILFTGGTTGAPKGVLLTARNLYRSILDMLEVFPITERDHVLSVLPLFHVMPLLANLLAPLYTGTKVTYLHFLEPQRIVSAFRDEKITAFLCVPQFYYQLHRRIFEEAVRQPRIKRMLFRRLLSISRLARRRLGWNLGKLFFGPVHRNFGRQLRAFGVGGAGFAPEIGESLRDLGFELFQAYGMTETGGLATATPLGPKGGLSCGRPVAHVELRIDQPDESGTGEVLVRGENIMKGYWQDPEATDAVLRDGWLHTGDLGYRSADGCLHVTGRKKDVIVLSSGKNIFPEELERVYQSNCPPIQEMCIVGVAGSAAEGPGENLHAVIVPNFEYLKSRQIVNIHHHVRYHLESVSRGLPGYKRVRTFEIRTEPLPRTTTRKLQRFQVRPQADGDSTRFARAEGEATPSEQTPAEREILGIIRRIKKGVAASRAMSFELDLKFDSLERVELLANVEEVFGIRIADQEAAAIFTVNDLVRAVEERISGRPGGRHAWREWHEILTEPATPEESRLAERYLKRRPVLEPLSYFAARFLYGAGKLLLHLRVEGRDLLPRDVPMLLCPNHNSYLDLFLLAGALPFTIYRRLFFLGASKYFNDPIRRWLGRVFRIVPVDADTNLRKALRLGAAGLRKGMVLCVFPEGGRSIEGTLKAFRKGPAILASEVQVPMVPVGILGTFEVWGRGAERIRLHPVRIRIGRPIAPDCGSMAYDALTSRLFEAVKAALDASTGSAEDLGAVRGL